MHFSLLFRRKTGCEPDVRNVRQFPGQVALIEGEGNSSGTGILFVFLFVIHQLVKLRVCEFHRFATFKIRHLNNREIEQFGEIDSNGRSAGKFHVQ